MRRHKSHAVGDLCKRGCELPAWDALEAWGDAGYAAARAPRAGDVELVFYRDANAWCPFCHRVWFALEHKGLRYATRRVHLRGDPREPAKQDWYLTLVPSGVVPALSIDGVLVTDSLAILRALDAAVPAAPRIGAAAAPDVGAALARAAAYDCDGDAWLRNRDPRREAGLRAAAVAALARLEADALPGAAAGPFFGGDAVSIVDCAFVGFLTRLDANYAFFKAYEIRASHPKLAKWFAAIERTRGFRATRQDRAFEQRIYQFDPARRPHAEACMGLDAPLVGEPPAGAAVAFPVTRLGAAAAADVRSSASFLFGRERERERETTPAP